MDLNISISEMVKEIEKLKAEALNKVKDSLTEIPGNENITRVSTNPNCFIMSSKHLGNNWSPEHHDNLYQAKALQEIVTNCESLSSMQNALQGIIDTGRCQSVKFKWLTFNNEVREFLRQIMGNEKKVSNN